MSADTTKAAAYRTRHLGDWDFALGPRPKGVTRILQRAGRCDRQSLTWRTGFCLRVPGDRILLVTATASVEEAIAAAVSMAQVGRLVLLVVEQPDTRRSVFDHAATLDGARTTGMASSPDVEFPTGGRFEIRTARQIIRGNVRGKVFDHVIDACRLYNPRLDEELRATLRDPDSSLVRLHG